jgi:hypothetical protein
MKKEKNAIHYFYQIIEKAPIIIIARKRISFKLVYEICNYLINTNYIYSYDLRIIFKCL